MKRECLGVTLVRFITLALAWTILCLTAASAKELKLRIESLDGLPAQVSVQGKILGSTGEQLSFDITEFSQPLFLDVVLSRPGFLPTLHTLPVENLESLWEPEPLALCQAVNRVQLRVSPGASTIEREFKNGQTQPAGKDGELLLEAGKLAPGQPFVPQSVVLLLHESAYQTKRVVLPKEIWSHSVYPPEGTPSIDLEPTYGLSAWWLRTGSQNLGVIVLGFLLLIVATLLARMRYLYLRQVESAHLNLQVWVERLDTFVEGSRTLATPVKVEQLAQESMLQAKRLTRSDWEWVVFLDPDFASSSDDSVQVDLAQVTEHLKKTPDRPLNLARVEGSIFSELSPSAASLMAQSMTYEGSFRGFLLVASTTTEGAFSETDQEALRVLCHQLSGTVERLRLHEETVEAYRKLAESEQQLVQAAKMAAVGQLAAGVAHEMNTPLNAINLGIEMAQRNLGSNPETAEKRLDLARTAVKRASEIVSKLLYYSREGLRESQSISLTDLLNDSVSLVSLQLAGDDIEVERAGELDFSLVGNPTELTQIFTSLMLNARDAILNSEGAPRVIEVMGREENDVLILTVKDHGAGIAEDIRDRIFDPFFSSKNMGKGTGLGLSVSQKIAERHGGQLTLESGRNPTVFSLQLPLAEK